MPLAYSPGQKKFILQNEGYDPDKFDFDDNGNVFEKPKLTSVSRVTQSPAVPTIPQAPEKLDTFRRSATESIIPTIAGIAGTGAAAYLTGGAGGATSGAGGNVNVTGGAGTAGNGNGGSVIIAGGAQHGSGIPGAIYFRSPTVRVQSAATAKTTSSTLTVANLAPGINTINQGGGATSAQQLPLASDMDAGFPGFATNDSLDISIINISTVDAEDASVTTNTGWTLVGSMDFHAYSAAGSLNSSGILRLVKTGTATWTAYRIA